MTPIADILGVAAGILLVVAYRRHRNGWDLVGAAVCVALLAWDLSRWPAVRLRVGPAEVALVVAVGVAYFNVVGFPRLVVRHLRVGYRSAKLDFDRRLYDEKARLDRLLLAYPSADERAYRQWRTKVLGKGRRILRALSRVSAPDAEWAAVRDGYVQLYRDILDRVDREEHPDNADTLRRGTALKNHADVLRIAYRTEALIWMSGSDRH